MSSELMVKPFPVWASLGSLPTVAPLVPAQVGAPAKAFPAVLAHVRSLSCMGHLMSGEVGPLGKALATAWADIGLLPQYGSYSGRSGPRSGQRSFRRRWVLP